MEGIDIAKYSLIVLGVDNGTTSEKFKPVYQKIVSLSKPVLIYTGGNRGISFINTDEYILEYPYYSIVTSPIRLVGDIFTTLSTFPTNKWQR